MNYGSRYRIGSSIITYGQFWYTFNTTASAINENFDIVYNQSSPFNNNVILSAGPYGNTRMVLQKPGIYNLQFSCQFDKPGGGNGTARITFKKNGVALPDTGGSITLNANNSQVSGWNVLDKGNAGDYYELAWRVDNTGIIMPTLSAFDNVAASPSVIFTITQIDSTY